MSLSSRLYRIPQIDEAERRKFMPDSSGPASSQHLRLPEWRRRQLERLAKVGRVADKELER